MSRDEESVEAAIHEAGHSAPRITPAMVDAEVADVDYHVFPKTCLTVCAITLHNGFVVTGTSACASPENFDADIGRSVAFAQARDEIWSLLGFRLRDQALT